jgi:DNA-binding NarL/FixJ family response regulator
MDENSAPRGSTRLASDVAGLRIAVVSEVRLLREGLAEILGRGPYISVVGLNADLTEAVALSPALRPDIMLVDGAYPGGPAAVTQIRQRQPNLRIVVFAVRETEENIIAWAEAGVIGYIPSTAGIADLVRLVTSIHNGEQTCSDRVAGGLLRRIARTAALGTDRSVMSSAAPLTPRERQTAELIIIGLSDKEIARRLNIGLGTTKSHVHSLLGKLNLRRRGQVAARWRAYAQHASQVLGVAVDSAD